MRKAGGFAYLYDQARYTSIPRILRNASYTFLAFYSIFLIPVLLSGIFGGQMGEQGKILKLAIVNIIFYFLNKNIQTRLGNYIKNTHTKVWDRNIKNNSNFNQNELDIYHQNYIKIDEKYSNYLRNAYYDYGVYHNQAHFYFVTIILYDKKLKQISKLIYYADENYQNLTPIPQALLNTRQGKYLTKESADPEWVIPHNEKSFIRIPIYSTKPPFSITSSATAHT